MVHDAKSLQPYLEKCSKRDKFAVFVILHKSMPLHIKPDTQTPNLSVATLQHAQY